MNYRKHCRTILCENTTSTTTDTFWGSLHSSVFISRATPNVFLRLSITSSNEHLDSPQMKCRRRHDFNNHKSQTYFSLQTMRDHGPLLALVVTVVLLHWPEHLRVTQPSQFDEDVYCVQNFPHLPHDVNTHVSMSGKLLLSYSSCWSCCCWYDDVPSSLTNIDCSSFLNLLRFTVGRHRGGSTWR